MSKLLNPTTKELEEFVKNLPYHGISKSINTRFTFLPETNSGKETPVSLRFFESYMPVAIGQTLKFNGEIYIVTEHRLNLDKGVFDVIVKYPKND